MREVIALIEPTTSAHAVDLLCEESRDARDALLLCYDECLRLFVRACYCGGLKYAKWLHSIFDFQADDVKGDGHLFLYICNYNLEFIKWYCESFRVSGLEVRKRDVLGCSAFRWMCHCGRLEVARWLHAEFEYTCEDVKSDLRSGMQYLGGVHDAGVVEWLRQEVGLVVLPYMKFDGAPPSTSTASPASPGDEQCCICMFRKRDLVCKPCGHDIACLACAYAWYAKNAQDDGVPGRVLLDDVVCLQCTARVAWFESV